MRLTLRTLLAYLDDLLEPSQAKELGAKIQESEMASELVSKIRDVIRKRRLTAPVVSGPGCDLDANLVAEYLDNTLSPEGVTDLEQICLDSDVHLAEVAASHQILTLVLGEPVDIGPLSRERMYALGEAAKSTTPAPVATTIAGQSATVAMKPTAAAAPAAAGLSPAVKPVAGSRLTPTSVSAAPPFEDPLAERKAEEPFDRTIPDYLRAPPLWKRALPLAIALLVIVWLGVLFRDQEMVRSILGGKAPPVAPLQVADASGNGAAKVADEAAVPAKDGAPANQAPATEQLVAENPEKMAKKTAPEAPGEQVAAVTDPKSAKPSIDPPPPADAEDLVKPTKPTPATKPATPAPEEEPSPFQAPGTAVAKADTTATKTKAQTKPPVTTPNPAPPEATPAVRSNPAQYVSPDGIVVHYDADRAGWYQLPHRSHVFADDALAVPEPFDAQIQMGREKHRLTVMGPAVVGVTDPMKDLPMGINLLRGRVILQPAETTEAAGGAPAAPVKMLLSVQGSTWRLELADPATRCGIEVIPREPRQLEEDFQGHGWHGNLYVWSGSVKVTNSEGQEQTLTAPDSLVLAADPHHPNADPTNSKDLPNWDRRLSTIAQKNARLFADEFKADESSAHDALLGLVDSRVYALSRLAVSCLGLVGDYEMMLEVLDRNEHHESRVEAIKCLRVWVNLEPENRVKLKEAIAAKFYPQEVDVVYRLIWGFQEQDARSKQTSELLIDWLEHDRLAVRELAWFYIKSLTNRKLEVFDARGTPVHINAAVQKIRKILEKDGTLLPPLPMPVKAGAAAENK
ncbi:MAG: hypothetical protein JWN70_806 [Planctomycetaceae bacterium]|nr:hypothetical protein [Planctomycetaceae bacterium]